MMSLIPIQSGINNQSCQTLSLTFEVKMTPCVCMNDVMGARAVGQSRCLKILLHYKAWKYMMRGEN